MQSIVMLNVICAECHIQALYVECRNAECRGAKYGTVTEYLAINHQVNKPQ